MREVSGSTNFRKLSHDHITFKLKQQVAIQIWKKALRHTYKYFSLKAQRTTGFGTSGHKVWSYYVLNMFQCSGVNCSHPLYPSAEILEQFQHSKVSAHTAVAPSSQRQNVGISTTHNVATNRT
jgi:hypothetical protein